MLVPYTAAMAPLAITPYWKVVIPIGRIALVTSSSSPSLSTESSIATEMEAIQLLVPKATKKVFLIAFRCSFTESPVLTCMMQKAINVSRSITPHWSRINFPTTPIICTRSHSANCTASIAHIPKGKNSRMSFTKWQNIW